MSGLIRSIGDAVASVPRDAVVAIAGASGLRRPMALVRELARQGRTDIRLVAWADGSEASVIGCTPLRVVPAQAFHAGALGVDFVPVRPSGDDGAGVVSPVSGIRYDVIEAVRPDVVLLHADAADEDGTVLLRDGSGTWRNDSDLVSAGLTVIASVERLVSGLAIADAPRDRVASAPKVTAIVHAPFGAHPLAYPGLYPADAGASSAPAADHWAYLDRVGIARLITRSTTPKESTQ